MPPSSPRLVVGFCSAVGALGLALTAAVISRGGLEACLTPVFGLLLLGVLLGEFMPLKLPLRSGYEEVNLSTPFAFAMLLSIGLAPALVAQLGASLLQDVVARKPLWRSVFNVGQYAICLTCAAGVLAALDIAPSTAADVMPFAEIVATVLAGVAFYIVNFLVVGTAVAAYQGTPVLDHLRNDARMTAAMAGVSISVAPLVLASVDRNPALVVLFALPIMALHWSARIARDSAYRAMHDALTELPNRTQFRSSVEAAIGSTGPSDPLAVLLLDLDRFKDINDTLGHHYGDLVLEAAARRLKAVLGPGDVLARLGGDEFAVMSRSDVAATADRLAAALQAPVELGDLVLDVDASIGSARYPEDGADLETLLRRADMAMYSAKERHLGHVPYTPAIDEYDPARLALVADLRRGLHDRELVLHYQPKLDLSTGRVRSVEALVRWNHPRLGLLQPGAFVEMAEHTGLIKPLTVLVLEMALEQRAAWHEQGLSLDVAVNISPRSLLGAELPPSVGRALERSGTNAVHLQLELTETAIMVDPDAAMRVLEQLASMGVLLSIDDFGTGYSSLAYLKRLPVSEVKIDRSFVQGLASDTGDRAIVRSTIDLASNLGLAVVAEGVEDGATIEALAQMGCDVVQGFHISRPLPADELVTWLRLHYATAAIAPAAIA